MTLKTQGIPKSFKGKGELPPETDSLNNLDKPADGQKEALQVLINPELRQQFTVYAASHRMKLNALWESVWTYYMENHG
jgi:hypothetical protein|tara:strand:- start:72 stop:308 length:237 start_codon:yes stop_codon:yes gene_type:complete